MLRSALRAVRSAVLQPEYSRQLSYVQVSRLFGTQLRYYSAQSNPDTSSTSSKDDTSSAKDEPNKDQKTSESETKIADSAKEEKESEHDRLLKEKEGLIKDLQVSLCHYYVLNITGIILVHYIKKLTLFVCEESNMPCISTGRRGGVRGII